MKLSAFHDGWQHARALPVWLEVISGTALVFALLLTAASARAQVTQDHRTVHIRGSTTFGTIVQSLAEQYMRTHPSTTVVVSGGGTSRGYITLLDNTADVAMVSGAPSEETLDEITRSGVKLVNVPFRRVAMAAAVHFTNPVNDLSTIQLREIFTGRITNWNAVGGKNAPINVYIGPPGDGITNTWHEKILGDADTFTPRARNAELEQRIAGVSGDPFGITYLATESLKDRALKVLSVDKVMAGADSVLSGRYTLTAPLMFVTREKPSPEVQKFLHFVNNLSLPISNSVFALPVAK
ncbi:MAG TPA: phosphate ABC transporter substrate-binding protein [Polaromonas sp.]|uniref:phosphate ABC transporter substrate-binding protein n=1 Tax=Polaromonas sp. TaxID=1869339 RepID=UPI002D4AAF7A|nr:phosphate ABC transporter substrate-binding protein [Polaromonas sp.]HYW58632.1 phosphate ABC transporter substrate-binding protein [Polaromonas sp.]